MTALPIIANTFRCAVHWASTSGQSAINVMHITKAGSTAAAVAAALDAAATNAMWTCMSSTATADHVSVTPLDGSTATALVPLTAGHWNGAFAGDFSPATAQVVSLRTALRGRSFRGRLFLPFGPESALSNGTYAAANVATAQGAWTAFIAALVAAGFPLVVASYRHATASAVLNVLVEAQAGTQRRRQTRIR